MLFSPFIQLENFLHGIIALFLKYLYRFAQQDYSSNIFKQSKKKTFVFCHLKTKSFIMSIAVGVFLTLEKLSCFVSIRQNYFPVSQLRDCQPSGLTKISHVHLCMEISIQKCHFLGAASNYLEETYFITICSSHREQISSSCTESHVSAQIELLSPATLLTLLSKISTPVSSCRLRSGPQSFLSPL